MRKLFCSFIIIPCLFISLNTNVFAQAASAERAARVVTQQAQTARAQIQPRRQVQEATVQIDAGSVFNNSGLAIQAQTAEEEDANPAGSMNVPNPALSRLEAKLSPKRPFVNKRAFINMLKPSRVAINQSQNYVEYRREQEPGKFTYAVLLDEGKKYLVEYEVEGRNGFGRDIVHEVGNSVTTHTLQGMLRKNTFSTVISSPKRGWVSGSIYQGQRSPNLWRVYSVKFTELD